MAEPLRFFFDQHVPSAVMRGLRQQGVDVLTAQEAGRCGLSDQDQLDFATSESRVMMTFDPDYVSLHATGATHAGIACCPATKYTNSHLIQMLLLLHAVLDRASMQNHIEHL